MARILYLFVDESGNPDDGDVFSLVGCWCVSERDTENDVLSSTRAKLMNHVRENHNPDVSELKGSKLPPSLIDTLMAVLQQTIYSDPTIESSPVWDHESPIRYSVYSTTPALVSEFLSGRISAALSTGQMLRVMSLISIIDPVFRRGLIDLTDIDAFRVVLDDTVWSGPADIVEECFRAYSQNAPLDATEFVIGNSRAVPGLQIADLAVYSWTRNRQQGDCEHASQVVRDYRV